MGERLTIPSSTRIVRDVESSLRRYPCRQSRFAPHILPYVTYLNDNNWKLQLASPPLPKEGIDNYIRSCGWYYEEIFPSKSINDWYEVRDYVDSIMTQMGHDFNDIWCDSRYNSEVMFRATLQLMNEWHISTKRSPLTDVINSRRISVHNRNYDDSIVIIIENGSNYNETHFYLSRSISCNDRKRVETEFIDKMNHLVDPKHSSDSTSRIEDPSRNPSVALREESELNRLL